MSIFAKLKEKSLFTETEQNIAMYLLQHKELIPDLTISDITQATYTSNASIMRLCKRLGLQGFRDLRNQIIKETERHRSYTLSVNMNYPFLKSDSADVITGAVSDLMIETLQDMKTLQLTGMLLQFSGWLNDAHSVYYYAEGDTLLTVRGFANRLIKLGIQAFKADENKEMSARMELMKKDDIFFCVTYSGKTLPTEHEMQFLQKKQVKCVLVTAAKGIKGFDHIITLPHREHDYDAKISTFYSQTAILYLLNCVYSILYAMKTH